MKIAFFDPYLDTLGGGERYTLTLAQHLQGSNETCLFWDDPSIFGKVSERLGIDLTNVSLCRNVFAKGVSTFAKFRTLSQFDLLFFVSDGSLPFSTSRRTVVHFQVPFTGKHTTIVNRLKLSRINQVVCNSVFTKGFIDNSYGVSSSVIYPPVNVTDFSVLEKERIILSAGRFSSSLHPKRQDFMVKTFRSLVDEGLKDWKLILVGGSVPDDRSYIHELRRLGEGYPVEIIENAPFSKLLSLYGRSSVYWHATGYGEVEKEHPERFEHFGITTVEAMAAGCVPVVIGRGGQREIVMDGINGFLWEDEKQFKDMTRRVYENPSLLKQLSKEAIGRSREFDTSVFIRRFDELLFGQSL